MATTVYLAPIGNGAQFLGTSLVLLNGGQLITYAAGTTTSTSTFTTSSGAVANTNPIVLGSDGRPPQEIWFTGGQAYKFVLQDSASTTIATYDNLYGIGDPFATNASQPIVAYGVTGSNTIAATVPSGYTFASSSPLITFIPVSTNTSSVTLNFTPLGQAAIGAKNLLAGNTALIGGELHANIPVAVRSDGSSYQLMGPTFKQPTRTIIINASSTVYTTPTGATRLYVRAVGGGGGGGGATANAGLNGTSTIFGTVTAGGGTGGTAASPPGGAGGTASGGDINFAGSAGQSAFANAGASGFGGYGGCSVFGAAGQNNASSAGGNAGAFSGSGGAGGGNGAGATVGSGGGAGGYAEKNFIGPATSFTIQWGPGGAGGAAGTFAGGNGGGGVIIIDEFYN